MLAALLLLAVFMPPAPAVAASDLDCAQTAEVVHQAAPRRRLCSSLQIH
eukprot:SAG31_NODE_25376_length_462_cov_1.118457_1_plen_48_part_10